MLVTHRDISGKWKKINVDSKKAVIALADPRVCKCCKRGVMDFTKATRLSNEHWIHNECIEFMILPYVQELNHENHPLFRCPSCSTIMDMQMIKEEDRGFQRYHGYCPNDNCTNQNIDFVVKTDKEIII